MRDHDVHSTMGQGDFEASNIALHDLAASDNGALRAVRKLAARAPAAPRGFRPVPPRARRPSSVRAAHRCTSMCR
jgi:hypothetical protein